MVQVFLIDEGGNGDTVTEFASVLDALRHIEDVAEEYEDYSRESWQRGLTLIVGERIRFKLETKITATLGE